MFFSQIKECDVNALYVMLRACGVCAVTNTHTLVELASLAAGDEAFTIWIPGHAGQAILMRLTHLCS